MFIDIHEFVHVIIPVMLQSLQGIYYVKGGRVHDIYFKNTTNSIDWDIVANQEAYESIQTQLTKYANINNMTIISNDIDFEGKVMTHFGFKEVFYAPGDPYILDVIIDPNISTDFVTIDNINYMSLQDFVVDLLVTQSDRYKKTSKYTKDISKENVRKYASWYDIPDFDIYTVQKAIDMALPYVKRKLDKDSDMDNDMKDAVKHVVQQLDKFKINTELSYDDQTREYIKYISKLENEQDDIRLELDEDADLITWLDEYKDYINEVSNYLVVKTSGQETFSKYVKTRKRYNNVINITWGNLSDKFKIYILTHCSDQKDIFELYNISKTCYAYIRCTDKVVNSSSDCINNELKMKMKNLDSIVN